MSINSITNCFSFNTALSDNKGEQFYYPNFDFNGEDNFGGVSLSNAKSNDSLQANVETIDDRFVKLGRLKLLKIDAEGMESNILKGSFDLIKRTKPFLYVENDIAYFDKSKELIELIWSLGYKIFWHIIPLYDKDNFFKNEKFISKFSFRNMFGFSNDKSINIDLPEITDSSYHPLNRKSSE